MLLVQRVACGINYTPPDPPPSSSPTPPQMETPLSISTLSSLNSRESRGRSSGGSERSRGNREVKNNIRREDQAPLKLQHQCGAHPSPRRKPQHKSLPRLPSHPPPTQSQCSLSPHPPTPSSPPPIFTLRPALPKDAPQIALLGSTTFAETFGFSIPRADLHAYLAEAYDVDAVRREIGDEGVRIVVAVVKENQCQGVRDVSNKDLHNSHTSPPIEAAPPENSQNEQQPNPQLNPSKPPSTDPSAQEKIIGFAQLNLSRTTEPSLADFPQQSLIELQRIYVHRAHQGTGVGAALLRAAEDLAYDIFRERTRGERAGGIGRKLWLGVWEGNFTAQKVYERQGYRKVGEHEFRMGRCIQTDWIMVKELDCRY